MEEKRVEESRIELTQVMNVTDANMLGNVHGGIIMKLCDEAGGMVGVKHSRHPVVTVAVDSMHFPDEATEPPLKYLTPAGQKKLFSPDSFVHHNKLQNLHIASQVHLQ